MYSSLLGGSVKNMPNNKPKTQFSALLSKEEKHFPAGFTDPQGHKGGQFAPKDTTGEAVAETKEKPFVYADGQTSLVNSLAANKPKETPDVSPEDLVAHHKAGLEKSAKLLNQYIKQDGGKPTDTNAKILAGNIANHVDALTDLAGMSKEELAKGLSTQGLSMWLKKKHGLPLTAQEEKNIASTMKSAIALQNKKQAAKKLEDHKKNSALAEEAKVKFGEDSAQYKKLKNKAEKDLNKAMSYGVLPADAVKEKEVVKENHDAEKIAQLIAIRNAAEELAHQEHMGTQNTAYYNAVSDAVAAAKYLDENETNKAIAVGKDACAAKIANGKNLLSISVIAHAQVQHQQHEAKDSDAYKEYKDAANAYKYYYNTGAVFNGLNKDDLKESVKAGKLAFASMKANNNMGKVVPPEVPGMEKLAPAPKPAVEVKPEPPKTFSDISAEAKAKDGLQKLVDLTTSYNAHMTMPNNQTYYSDFLEAKKNFDTTMGVGYSDKALAAYYTLKNTLAENQAKDKEAEKEAQKKDFFGGLDYMKAYPDDKKAATDFAASHNEINDTYGAGTTLGWLKEYNAKNKPVEPKAFDDFVNDSKAKGNTGKLAYMINAHSDHKSAPTPDTQAMLNGAKASLDASMGVGYSDKALAAYDKAAAPKPAVPAAIELTPTKKKFFKQLNDKKNSNTPLSGFGIGNPWLKEYQDASAEQDKSVSELTKLLGIYNAMPKDALKVAVTNPIVVDKLKSLFFTSMGNPDVNPLKDTEVQKLAGAINAAYQPTTVNDWIAEHKALYTVKQPEDTYAKAQAELAEAVKDPYTPMFAGHDAFFKALGDHAKNPLPLGVLNDLIKTVDATFGVGTGNQWLKHFGDVAAKAKVEDKKAALLDAAKQAEDNPSDQGLYSKFVNLKLSIDNEFGPKTAAGWVTEKDKAAYFKAIDSTPDSPSGDADPKLMQMKKDIDTKYGDGTANSWIAEKIKGMHADNSAVKENVKASYLSVLSYANPDASQQSAIAEMKKNIDAKYGAGTATKWMVDDLKEKGNAETTPETKPSFVDPTVVSPDKKQFFKDLKAMKDAGTGTPTSLQSLQDAVDKKQGAAVGSAWTKEFVDASAKQYKASGDLDAALKDKTLTKPAVQKLFFDALGHPDITPLKGEIITQMTDAIDDVYGNGEGNSWLGNYVASYQQKEIKDKAKAGEVNPPKYVYGQQAYGINTIKADALAALRIPHTLDDKSDLIQDIIDKAKEDIDTATGVKGYGFEYLNTEYTDHSNDNPNPEFSDYAKDVATRLLVDAQAKTELPDLISVTEAAVTKLAHLKQDVDKYFGQGASADLLDSYDEAKADHKKQFFANMDAVKGGKANAANALVLGMHINKVDELFGKGTSSLWADEFNSKKLWEDAYGGNPPKPVDQKAEDKKKYINSYIANLMPEHKPIEQTMNAKYGVATVQGWVTDFYADKKMLQGKNKDYLNNPSPEAVAAISSTTKTIDAAYGDGTAKYMLTGYKPDVLGSKSKPKEDTVKVILDKDTLLAASDTLAATGATVADAADYAKKVNNFNSLYGDGAASAYIKEAKKLKIPNDMDVSGANGTTPLAWKEIIKDNYDSSTSSGVFKVNPNDEYPQLSNVDKSYGTGMHQYWLTQHIESLNKDAKPAASKYPKDVAGTLAEADYDHVVPLYDALIANSGSIANIKALNSAIKGINAVYPPGTYENWIAYHEGHTTLAPAKYPKEVTDDTTGEKKYYYDHLAYMYDAATQASKNQHANALADYELAETKVDAVYGYGIAEKWMAHYLGGTYVHPTPPAPAPAPVIPVDPKAVKAATAKMKKSVLAAAKALIANPTSPEHAAKFSSTLSDADAKYGNGTALKWIGAANKKEAKASGDSVSALSLPKELGDVIAAGDKSAAQQKTAIPKLPDVLPTDKTEAEALNDKLGMAYYTIRHENGGDKNAPDVLAAYKVWDTLKDHMKAKLGYDKNFFSSSSSNLNSAAQNAWSTTGQAKQDKKEKATSDYVDSVAAWGAEAAKKNVDPEKEDYLKDMMVTNAKVAVDSGVPSNTLGTLFDAGKANSAAFVKKQKDDAMKEIAAASHDYFMKSGLKGEDDPETKAANMNALNIMAKHSMLLSEAERIDAFGRSKGSAEKAVANLKLLGDLGAVAQKYDSGEINCIWCPKDSEAYEKVKEVGEALWKSFTPKQQAAFKDYTGSGHSSANKSLAAGSGNSLAETLSKAMDGQSLGVDMKLRRNMPQKWFWKAMGLPYSDNRNEMNSLTDEQLLSCIGKVYREPALSSASYDENNTTTVTSTGDQSGYANLRIRAAKDISQGAWLDYHSGCPSEREILMNKGATYLIRGIERDDSNYQFPYKIDMDLIGYTEEPKK